MKTLRRIYDHVEKYLWETDMEKDEKRLILFSLPDMQRGT